MIRKLVIMLLSGLLLTGCYGSNHKDAAFMLKDGVSRIETALPDISEGIIVLKCDSFPKATCPDRVPADDFFTAQITVPALLHSSYIRRMQFIYGFAVYNLPTDFQGCVLGNVVTNRRETSFDSAGEIKREDVEAMIDRINVRHPLPLQRCWSSVYRPTNFEYRDMALNTAEKRFGSRIIQMNNVEWGNENVSY